MYSITSDRKSGKWLTLAALSSAFIFLAGCDNGQQQQQQQMPPAAVSVFDVQDENVGSYQEFVARTEAMDTVELRARVEGFLVKRDFDEGQTVKKDQLLFEIDPKPYEAALKRAEADLASAEAELVRSRRDLARTKDLFNKGHVSQANLDSQVSNEARADASVKAAKASLDTARLNLGYTRIYAPFKGQIGKSAYSVGNLVGPTSLSLATLTTVDPMYVNFQVDERQLVSHLEADANGSGGEKFNFTLTLPNGSEYNQPGSLNFADTTVDQSTGTLTLRAEFPNPNGILLPGLFVNLAVEGQNKQPMPVIPQSAVQENQSGRFVLVVTPENQVESRQITTGRRIGPMWAVTEGLKDGEKIIVEGLQKVRPGAPVAPTVVAVDPQTGAITPVTQNKGN